MFGYLLPDKQELKVKEFAQYRAAYCGICRAIKLRYGELPRLAVSYDAAVFAVLLAGVSGKIPVAKRRRCVLNPVQPKPVFEGSAALDYMAAVSVLLAWGRLKDAWADERQALAPVAMGALALARRRAQADFPALASHIEGCLNELSALEKAGSAELDRPADAMGKLLSGILLDGMALEQGPKVLLRSIGYHLGRWVYLVDALDDREKDAKSGSYNVLLRSGDPDAAAALAAEQVGGAASGVGHQAHRRNRQAGHQQPSQHRYRQEDQKGVEPLPRAHAFHRMHLRCGPVLTAGANRMPGAVPELCLRPALYPPCRTFHATNRQVV